MNWWTNKVAASLCFIVALTSCTQGDAVDPFVGSGSANGGLPHSTGGASGEPGGATPEAGAPKPDGGPSTVSIGDGTCASANVGIRRLTPTVQVVVDASGSMAEPFGGCTTRWDCLRDALIGEAGLITELQDVVSFGLTLYGGQIAKVRDGEVVEVIDATCPRVLHVPSKLQNRDAIAVSYDVANPGGGTPTAEALQRVIDVLPDAAVQLDNAIGKQIILLVTDGDPNVCEDPVATSYGPTEAQALRAQQKHIQLFAMTVADDQNAPHLQRMANLGAGMAADATPGAPYFEPGDGDELSQVLREIVGGAVGCDVQLEGAVEGDPGDECEGEVSLNGNALECNGPDGWRLSGESTLVLQGEACERFKFDPSVTLGASFPCELVTLL